MGTYIESGLGKATSGGGIEMGRRPTSGGMGNKCWFIRSSRADGKSSWHRRGTKDNLLRSLAIFER
jgi:hypothetical protein